MSSINVDLQKNLTPITLTKEDVNYTSAEVLNEKLREGEACNIAVTGYYGTGKSSVINTAEELAKDSQLKFLKISLATLQCEEQQNEEKSDSEPKQIKKDDLQHIELSILQQIFYQETREKLPLSNVKRMTLQNKDSLQCIAFDCIIYILCILVLFEPKWARVDTLYDFFNWGEVNILFDAIAACFLIGYTGYALYKWIIPMIIRGSHNVKFSIGGAEVELADDQSSVFNRYIEEIFYFFRNTDYNVVVFEDLDRFQSGELFLKLRELNLLLNANKNIVRHITFVYAVRDDLFKDASRTKFFDYIVPVIPVINSDNCVQKLKELLSEMGEQKISDNDAENIGGFIKDLRLMQNICNEYQIYQTNLSQNLEHTKLFAMIVYKNYCPEDFAYLTRSDEKSKIYKCISLKQNFVKWAIEHYNEEKRKRVEEEKKALERVRGLKQSDLIASFLTQILNKINKSYKFEGFEIGKNLYSVLNLSHDMDAFSQLVKQMPNIKYKYVQRNSNMEHSCEISISSSSIETDMGLEKPILEILDLMDSEKMKELDASIRKFEQIEEDVPMRKLSSIIVRYHLEECEDFKDLNLTLMQEFFLTFGYIDENYCDYTSRFIEGSLTEAENRLLIEMKLHHVSDINIPIIHLDAFVKKLPNDVYNSRSILNISLVAYLSDRNLYHEKQFNMVCDYIVNNFLLAKDFVLSFYKSTILSEDIKLTFFCTLVIERYIWGKICAADNEDLMEMWLSYCGKEQIGENQRQWLSNNFQFLAMHWNVISTHHRNTDWLEGCLFEKLTNDNESLLDFVVKSNKFIKNVDNYCVILNHSVTRDNINLMRMLGAGNKIVNDSIAKDLPFFIKNIFSKIIGDESEECMIYIVNNIGSNVDDDTLLYLKGQKNKIEDVNSITNDQLALETNILKPSWENFVKIYNRTPDGLRDYQRKFLEDNAKDFAEQPYPQDAPSNFTSMILFGAWIPDNVAMKVSGQVDNFVSDDEQLSSLSMERIEKLLYDKHIAYSEQNTNEMSKVSEETYRKYLMRYKGAVFSQIDRIPLTASLIRYFMFEQKKISNDNRTILLRSNKAQKIIASDSELAKVIAIYLTKKPDNVIAPDFYQALLNKTNDVTINSDLAKVLVEMFQGQPRWKPIFNRYIK